MSEPTGEGVSTDGVVRNSALSFVSANPAPAQPVMNPQDSTLEMSQTERLVPGGLKALCDAYSSLYPDQPNPMQVTTRLKYWLGGHDPLDYISMYWNPGKPEEHVPPHWHYVSFGLSDLHGDGRVHRGAGGGAGAGAGSGAGFELTLRLDAEQGQPPLWPAALMQALARYVITTGNKFCAGDHISWHAPLDGGTESRVRHILVARDPQLDTIDTPHGTVTFLQMVGCTGRELRAAQRGSGFEVLKLIGEDPKCGGSWLVTRARRRVSARRVSACSRAAAAHLAGVSAGVYWTHHKQPATEPVEVCELSSSVEQQIKDTLQRGLSTMSTDRTGQEGHTGMSTDSFGMSSIERALPQIPELMQGSWQSTEDDIEYLDGVHLIMNAEAASLLPLAIDGRVSHGAHFTWRGRARAVTVLAPAVSGALATPDRPYAAKGGWLQLLVPAALSRELSRAVSPLSRLALADSESERDDDTSAVSLPLHLAFNKHRLLITVMHDHHAF